MVYEELKPDYVIPMFDNRLQAGKGHEGVIVNRGEKVYLVSLW